MGAPIRPSEPIGGNPYCERCGREVFVSIGEPPHIHSEPIEAPRLVFPNSTSLDFADLRRQNVSRLGRWHDPSSEPWSGADWSNAMCGEAGEAANVVKKLRRHETRTSPQGDPDEATLRAALADELADVVTYCDLVAHFYGIDLATAVIEKFNRVSAKQDFPEQLTADVLVVHRPRMMKVSNSAAAQPFPPVKGQ